MTRMQLLLVPIVCLAGCVNGQQDDNLLSHNPGWTYAPYQPPVYMPISGKVPQDNPGNHTNDELVDLDPDNDSDDIFDPDGPPEADATLPKDLRMVVEQWKYINDDYKRAILRLQSKKR